VLKFRFVDAVRESIEFPKLASFFISREDQVAFRRFADDLARFRDSSQTEATWQTPMPISTKVSEGEYEVDGRGARVVGSFSTIWEIKKAEPGLFVIAGNASTSFSIMREDGSIVRSWNMDIAAHDSPGCHFHSQIVARGDGEWNISVPRLPGLAVSPFSAFEFLLSELFQTEWALRSQTANGAQGWRAVQKRRLEKLLAWAAREIDKPGVSPWVAFKTAKPNADLFSS